MVSLVRLFCGRYIVLMFLFGEGTALCQNRYILQLSNKRLSNWVLWQECHPLKACRLPGCLLLNNDQWNWGYSLRAVVLGPDSKRTKKIYQWLCQPLQQANNRHRFGSFSYLLQYLEYVLISQHWSGCPQSTWNVLVGDALLMFSDFTATLDRAFSGICWNNQMNICQEKFDRQNYGRWGHIEVKSCQLVAAQFAAWL
jgi:hypothetical protein